MKKKYPLEAELAKLNKKQFLLTRESLETQKQLSHTKDAVEAGLKDQGSVSKEKFEAHDDAQKRYYRNHIKLLKNLSKIKKLEKGVQEIKEKNKKK